MIQPPKIGEVIRLDVYGREARCKVLKVYPFGACDVERLSDGKCFRVSGLGWLQLKETERANNETN